MAQVEIVPAPQYAMMSADGETLVMLYAEVFVFVPLLGVSNHIKILTLCASRAGSVDINHVKASTHALESIVHLI